MVSKNAVPLCNIASSNLVKLGLVGVLVLLGNCVSEIFLGLSISVKKGLVGVLVILSLESLNTSIHSGVETICVSNCVSLCGIPSSYLFSSDAVKNVLVGVRVVALCRSVNLLKKLCGKVTLAYFRKVSKRAKTKKSLHLLSGRLLINLLPLSAIPLCKNILSYAVVEAALVSLLGKRCNIVNLNKVTKSLHTSTSAKINSTLISGYIKRTISTSGRKGSFQTFIKLNHISHN